MSAMAVGVFSLAMAQLRGSRNRGRNDVSAQHWAKVRNVDFLERETGIEPATSSLGSWRRPIGERRINHLQRVEGVF